MLRWILHLAISVNPQEAVAWRGVQPSLSQTSTSAPFSTKNSTIDWLSSIQACKQSVIHYKLKTLRLLFPNEKLLGILTLWHNVLSDRLPFLKYHRNRSPPSEKERGPGRERGEEGGRKERWGRMGRDIFPSKGKCTVKPRVFINQY